MPYIDRDDRPTLDSLPLQDVSEFCNEGGLNYAITTLVDGWLEGLGVNYKNLNAAIGALECAKLELYRRIAAPYEDYKARLNGDVYTCRPSS